MGQDGMQRFWEIGVEKAMAQGIGWRAAIQFPALFCYWLLNHRFHKHAHFFGCMFLHAVRDIAVHIQREGGGVVA